MHMELHPYINTYMQSKILYAYDIICRYLFLYVHDFQQYFYLNIYANKREFR